MEVITLKEAKEKGLKHYYTGVPCKYGHSAKRWVHKRVCFECFPNLLKKSFSGHNIKRALQNSHKTYVGQPCSKCNTTKRFVLDRRCFKCSHEDSVRVQISIIRARARQAGLTQYIGSACKTCGNTLRGTITGNCVYCNNVINKLYSKNNRQIKNAQLAKYRASKINATPQWVNLKEIQAIYSNCPQGMTVDHIVPLRGKTVSGLHVPWNLQYLTRSQNASKGNRLVT